MQYLGMPVIWSLEPFDNIRRNQLKQAKPTKKSQASTHLPIHPIAT